MVGQVFRHQVMRSSARMFVCPGGDGKVPSSGVKFAAQPAAVDPPSAVYSPSTSFTPAP